MCTRITQARKFRTRARARAVSEVGLFEAVDAPRAAPGWPPEQAARTPVTFANLRHRPAPLDSVMGLAMGRLRALFLETTDVSEVGLFDEAVDAPRGSGVAT